MTWVYILFFIGVACYIALAVSGLVYLKKEEFEPCAIRLYCWMNFGPLLLLALRVLGIWR